MADSIPARASPGPRGGPDDDGGRTTFYAMDVRAKAEAVRAYAHFAQDRSLEIEALAIRANAERKLGQLLKVERDEGRLAGHGREAGKIPERNLTNIGVSPKLSAQSARFAVMGEPEWQAHEQGWREDMASKPHGVSRGSGVVPLECAHVEDHAPCG